MMDKPYQTIAQQISAEQTIERSRFIGHCREVSTEAEAKEFIAAIRLEHAHANHNCYAYRIGNIESPLEYFNDHGEPSGTAGKPILGAIQRLDITNVVVVVTRYFGGKKLGVRGLIEAYGQTASLVLEQAGVITKVPKFLVKLEYEYAAHSLIQHRLQQVNAEIIATDFGVSVTAKLAIPKELHETFLQLVQELPVTSLQDI